MTEPWLDDGDVRLYHGDALETLRGLPDGSVDCVVTSPPYWGLRDYGTGEWAGGDHDCDHQPGNETRASEAKSGLIGGKSTQGHRKEGYGSVCRKCGATRVDQQLGLEPTPDLFVTHMVAVFREIRRVLADHGTCWVNLGDSYVSNGFFPDAPSNQEGATGLTRGAKSMAQRGKQITSAPGLKTKDLCGIPWRVAFALQADGWYLRSDIVWSKPNPMPESVTDRPTKAHEYVFMLTKRPRYFFDAEAVREPQTPDGRHVTTVQAGNGSIQHRDGERWPNPAGRNVRSVWQIATQPYPEAHFATFPEELARRCILAGCPVRVCGVCGKPSERIVEHERGGPSTLAERQAAAGGEMRTTFYRLDKAHTPTGKTPGSDTRGYPSHETTTVGWSDCGHNNWRPGVALDPFVGSGTVAKVARDHQRHAIGIDLSADYLALAARRLQQLSLLT